MLGVLRSVVVGLGTSIAVSPVGAQPALVVNSVDLGGFSLRSRLELPEHQQELNARKGYFPSVARAAASPSVKESTTKRRTKRVYLRPTLRARIVARASVTGWLRRVVSLPARVFGSRATPSWINRVRRSK
jgi:hypothetical protein